MAGLFHRFRQGNAAIGGFGQIAGAQPVGGKLPRFKPCHLCALLDDAVDGARFECTCGNIAPTIDFSKHTALIDLCRLQPMGEGVDRPTGKIDDFIVIGALVLVRPR